MPPPAEQESLPFIRSNPPAFVDLQTPWPILSGHSPAGGPVPKGIMVT